MKTFFSTFLVFAAFILVVYACSSDNKQKASNETKKETVDSLRLSLQPLQDSVALDTSLTFFVEHLSDYQDFIQELHQKFALSDQEEQAFLRKMLANQLHNYRAMYAFWLEVKQDEYAYSDTRAYFKKTLSRFDERYQALVKLDDTSMPTGLAKLTENSAMYRISYLPEQFQKIKARYFKRTFNPF